jgi:hypothetical protein
VITYKNFGTRPVSYLVSPGRRLRAYPGQVFTLREPLPLDTTGLLEGIVEVWHC